MYEWLRETMVGRLQLPAEHIRPEATAEEAGLDSLAVTELVLIVQDELGVTVDEDRLYGMRTVGDIADFLAQHTQPVAG
ncbi:acyl carrier protein [Streptomyces sp. NPDC093595]|uniref:acyl carrier protein n=1 Tax=Streptomyces sp. NPDC093595 TaxID=3366045 RepID=UPI00380EC0CC